ncbi:MAG: hypothetical protein PVG27_02190 [Chloroflexota bacterium]
MSRERRDNVLCETNEERHTSGESAASAEVRAVNGPTDVASLDPEAEAEAFVRFCYRRRSVAWPELYDEMCAVAARGDYRGMDYEQLQRLGIGFALASLPRLAALAERVIAQERAPRRIGAVA